MRTQIEQRRPTGSRDEEEGGDVSEQIKVQASIKGVRTIMRIGSKEINKEIDE
jgi:hypothetical protein